MTTSENRNPIQAVEKILQPGLTIAIALAGAAGPQKQKPLSLEKCDELIRQREIGIIEAFPRKSE
jgi:hypothetical protein